MDAGEINNKASVLPKASEVKPPKPPKVKPPQSAQEPAKDLSSSEEESIQRLCQIIESRVSFEEALLVGNACRSNDISRAEAAVSHMLAKMK